MMRKTKKKSGVDETNDFLSNLADVGAALTQHAMDVLSADSALLFLVIPRPDAGMDEHAQAAALAHHAKVAKSKRVWD
jgi:hypothetical protein